MNILHIGRTMGQGGAEKIIYQICEINTDEYKMFVASVGGFYEKRLKQIGVTHFCIPNIASKNPLTIIKTFMILRKIVEKYKIDVIHSHHRMAAFYAQIISRNTGVKLAYTAHNVWTNKKRLVRFALKNTKIIAVGKSVEENLVNVYGIERSRIVIVRNAVKNLLNKSSVQITKNKDDILIGVICRLSKVKGVDLFLKAFSIARESNEHVKAIIVGDGEERNKLECLAKELGLEKVVEFVGFQENVVGFIEQCDFLVLPSLKEGLPLLPIEAFSVGKPVIGTRVGGIAEVIENRKTGILVDSINVDALSMAIIELANNKKRLRDYGNNARKVYEEKFSFDIFLNGYMNFYKSLENGAR